MPTRTYHIKRKNASLWTEDWLPKEKADKYLRKFSRPDFPLESDPVVMVYGKKCRSHRRVGFFSDENTGYRFANQIAAAQPLTRTLRKLLRRVNRKLGTDFNGILINHYRDGSDNIMAHSDSLDSLSNSTVAGISLGVSRKFRIRNKKTKEIVVDFDTGHGEFLVMDGDFQKLFTHEIPTQKKVKGDRVSLTFRRHVVDKGKEESEESQN